MTRCKYLSEWRNNILSLPSAGFEQTFALFLRLFFDQIGLGFGRQGVYCESTLTHMIRNVLTGPLGRVGTGL